MPRGSGAFSAGSSGLRIPGAAEGVVWSEQAGASPSLPPCASGCMETRAHPFGTWSSLVHRAPRSCAGSLPVASNAPSLTGVFRLLSSCRALGSAVFPAPLPLGLKRNGFK